MRKGERGEGREGREEGGGRKEEGGEEEGGGGGQVRDILLWG